ncbi:RDD family protein [Metabacillus malikii]|uniref:RDD domain-containing protein n=1 Tax=Metabacillus malikii TaxID=1504265 RepID=A0ABT9ZLZ3_9BACI|nr:RDD family protein [Metabacillus malikii]MDQ0233320.1 hypothetical protein [Metabacillus malikii]
MVKKRIVAYVLDSLITLAICTVLSILPFLFVAVIALLFLPFVASYEDTWNLILIGIMNGILLLGAFVFFVISLGTIFKSTFTRGYKMNGLQIESTNKFRLFIWWFIRNGLAGLFIFIYAYHLANQIDYKYLSILIFIYIIYLCIDGILFFFTKGKRSFTDRWTGIDVLETTKGTTKK